MTEKGKAQPAGSAKAEEKAPPPKPGLIRDLWREKTRLQLHLTDGTVIAGRIKQFDQFNLQLLRGGE
jgi:hypothetical protein